MPVPPRILTLTRSATRLLALGLTACVVTSSMRAQPLPTERLRLPPGFRIETWARVPDARAMVLGDQGVLYVGSAAAGKVHALVMDAQYRPGPLIEVAKGLTLPIGLAFRDGSLYVSAVSQILRFDDIGQRLQRPGPPVVVRRDLPSERHHGGKYIAFGPDGWLYVPVGAPCNVCEPTPDRHGLILRMKPDGSAQQTYARGVRNTVGFDWQPGTGAMWFTENGRDMLGDDLPPDELNRASGPGQHFGFPYCHAGTLADPEFGAQHPCRDFTPPAQALGAHVAPLGMRFYTGTQFPAAYRGQVFIAEHGSWNRSRKSGYRVSLVKVEGNRAVGYEPFITGWLQGEVAWGRPTDVLVLPDGSLLVSDDQAGAIYRVRYQAP